MEGTVQKPASTTGQHPAPASAAAQQAPQPAPADNGHMTVTEAPVSWNVRYLTPDGYDAMLTLRGADVKAVMTLARSALDAMVKGGCKPQPQRGQGGSGNNGGGAAGGGPGCPTHGKAMKLSKRGDHYFCPVKIADDGGDGRPVYCKQRKPVTAASGATGGEEAEG